VWDILWDMILDNIANKNPPNRPTNMEIIILPSVEKSSV